MSADPYREQPFKNERKPCAVCGTLTGIRMTFGTHDKSVIHEDQYPICSDECADKMGGEVDARKKMNEMFDGGRRDSMASSASTMSGGSTLDLDHHVSTLFSPTKQRR